MDCSWTYTILIGAVTGCAGFVAGLMAMLYEIKRNPAFIATYEHALQQRLWRNKSSRKPDMKE